MFFKPFLLAVTAMSGALAQTTWTYKLASDATAVYVSDVNVIAKGQVNARFNAVIEGCGTPASSAGSCYDSGTASDWASCCQGLLNNTFTQSNTDGAGASIQTMSQVIYDKCVASPPSGEGAFYSNGVEVMYQCPFLTCNPTYWQVSGADSLNDYIVSQIDELTEGGDKSQGKIIGFAQSVTLMMKHVIQQYSLYEAWEASYECMGNYADGGSGDPTALDKAVAFWTGAYVNQTETPVPETSNKNLFEDSFTGFSFTTATSASKADKLTGYYNDIQSGINAGQCDGAYPTGDDIGDPSQFAVLGNMMYRIQGIESETQVRTLIQDLSAVSLSNSTSEALWWSSRRRAHDHLKIFEVKYGQCDKFASSIMLNYYDDSRADVTSATDPLPASRTAVQPDYFEWARETILTRVMSNLRCLNVYEDCENAIGTFTDSSGTYDCTELGYPAKNTPDGPNSLNFLSPIRNYTVDSKVTDHSYVEMDQQFCVNCMKDSKLGGTDKFRDMFASKAVYSWGQFSQKSTSARTMRNMAVSSKQNTFNPFFNQAAYQFYTENVPDPFGITQYNTTIANRFGDQLVQAAYGQDPSNPFYQLTDIDMQTRYEMASKAQQYNTLNYYILREGYDVIHDCEKNNNDNDQSPVGAKAVDEATVFATGYNLQDIFTGWDPSSEAFVAPTWAGITNGPNGNAYPGAVWCSLAEKYVPNEGDKDYNKPRFNAVLKNACSGSGGDNFIKLQKEIQAIAKVNVTTAGQCQDIVPLLEKTEALIAIPYIQGLLRYSYLTDPFVISAVDDNSENAEYAAEQYAFWSALAPTFMQCNPDAATRIANSMRFQIRRETTSVSSSRRLDAHDTEGVVEDTCGSNPTLCDEQHIGAEELWGLVYSFLPCMGLTCDQVGDGAEDWFPNGGGDSYPYNGAGGSTINLPTCSQINFNNPERPAPLNSDATDGDYIFAQYIKTSSDVREHAKISKDVRQIYTLAEQGSWGQIQTLYENGANSIKSADKRRKLIDMAEKVPALPEWVLPTLQCAYDDEETWATQKLSDLITVCETSYSGSTTEQKESCAEMLVQGYIFYVVAPYVGHEGDDCYQDCLGGNSTTNNAAVKACNEALAFYTGWDQPFDTVLDKHQSTYSQAEQIAQFFYDDPVYKSGRAGINGQSMDSYFLSEEALNGLDSSPDAATKTKICDSVHQAVRQFEGDITVTEIRYLAWTLLFHVGAVPSNLVSGAMKDFTFETVQIFESVLWPKIRMCNPVDAASFHSQLGGTEEVFDAITTVQQVEVLLGHIVNNCQCIGIDVCETIGPALKLLAGGADWNGDVNLSGQNITDIGKVGVPGTPRDGFDEILPVYQSLPDPKTCNLECDQPSTPGDEVNLDTCSFFGAYTNDEQFSNKYVCHPPQPVSTTGFVYEYSYVTNQNNLLLADTDSLAIQNFVDSGERFFGDAMAVYTEGRSNFIELCGTSTSPQSCTADATLPDGTPILAPSTYMTMQSIADASAQQSGVTFQWQTEDNNFFGQADIAGLGVGSTVTAADAYDVIITAALTDAALFAPPSNEWDWKVAAKSQIAKKTVQASATPQALRYFQEAQNAVCASVPDVQTALLKWESGAAMVFGSILGTTEDAIKGQFLAKFVAYRQSERIASITDKTVTFLNDQVQDGQTALATNSSTACQTITTINTALNKRVGLAYYQGMQKYAEKCKDGSCSSKYAGEMMAFAFQAVPRLYRCDQGAANFVMANVNIFQPTSSIMTYGLNAVMGAYEQQFPCLGWTCEMVGDLNADFPCQSGTTAATNTNVQAFDTAYAAWEAAKNPPSAGSSTSLSFVVATIAVMIAAAAF